jgi:hypothetical protein
VRRRLSPPRLLAVLLTALAALLAGCGGGDPANTSRFPDAHVIVIVEENHSLKQVLDSPDAPTFTGLARQGALLRYFYAIRHNSLPNYIALLGGDTLGITDDCETHSCHIASNVSSLPDQLDAAHLTWRGYMQGLPASCTTRRKAGKYVERHDPFMFFDSIRTNPSRCRNIVSLAQLGVDAKRGHLPNFALVVPDLNNDAHDGPLSAADTELARLFGTIRHSSAWQQNTVLVVTFDEGGDGDAQGCCGSTRGGGHILTFVIGPHVPASVDRTKYNQYALLRSIEQRFGLPLLRHAADPTTSSIPSVATPPVTASPSSPSNPSK